MLNHNGFDSFLALLAIQTVAKENQAPMTALSDEFGRLYDQLVYPGRWLVGVIRQALRRHRPLAMAASPAAPEPRDFELPASAGQANPRVTRARLARRLRLGRGRAIGQIPQVVPVPTVEVPLPKDLIWYVITPPERSCVAEAQAESASVPAGIRKNESPPARGPLVPPKGAARFF